MKHTSIPLFTLLVVLFAKPAFAQTGTFTGAQATLGHYKALYYLDENDPKKIKITLRNIDNALEDPRLKGKLEVELVAFADGYAVYDKNNPYGEMLQKLQKKGVILAQCNNTLVERHIDRTSLFPFINFVPSGNGEIIIRQADGWATIHP